MAEINASIPLGVQGPMQSIGGFLDVAKSMTALKAAHVGLESNEKVLEERNKVRALFQDPTKFMGEDGNFDYNKLVAPIMEAAPTTGGDIITKLFQGQRDSVAAKDSLLKLSNEQRAAVGQTIQAMENDPPDAVFGKLDALKKFTPQLGPAVDYARKNILDPAAPQGPEAFKAAIRQVGMMAMSPQQQAVVTQPSGPTFNTGVFSGQNNTNRFAPNPTGPITGSVTQNVVPPTSAESVGTDVNGNPIRVVRSPQGVISLEPMNTSGGAPGAASNPPMFNFPPGEDAGTKSTLQAERQGALATLRDAPAMHENYRGILREIDNTIATGALGPTIQGFLSRAGAAFSTPEEKASAYDLVGKYLERNALQAAQGMGPNTNAGLESQIRANGSQGYNPSAIKKIAKLGEALLTGSEMYQPGLEKAIQTSPKQVFEKRPFDQAWAQNFDPRVMELYNAQKAGDQRAIDEILNPNGKRLSAETIKELQRKAINLETLSTQGRL